MKFGELPLSEVLGGTLAHSIRLKKGLLKKGHILTETDIQTLAAHNITHVMAALLEPNDITENEAAEKISRFVSGKNITLAEAFTGRVNLYAAEDGLVVIDEDGVNKLNHMDEAITLATVTQNAIVHKGQMIATVKIIPLAVKAEIVTKIITQRSASLIRLHPFRAQKAILIQTELAGTSEKIFKKSKRVMIHRLASFGASLEHEDRCPHDVNKLADHLKSHAEGPQDMILIMGASAITDRRDVIPTAIKRAGGEVIHYGMPVDPGNLMLVAKLKGKWVIGLPGCSRSPKLNGIDLVLSRICSWQVLSREDIMDMGVGGLLSEYPGRPQPREKKQMTAFSRNIAALVLCAGKSSRMGQENKLLLPYQGGTVLSHILDQIKSAGINRIFAVTGHQKDKVAAEISPFDVTIFYNDLFEEGMSSSVKLGISSLPKDIDGVIIILGDMPNISSDILKQILAAYNPVEGHSIIIPKHNNKRGNPILWDHEFFSDFDRLEGDMGAKMLLNEYPEFIHEVEIDSEAIFLDMDTLEAYERLKSK